MKCSNVHSVFFNLGLFGPYWISYSHSGLHTCRGCDIHLYCMIESSAWYSVILHLRNVFKCYNDVKTTFSQSECKGFLNQENLMRTAKEFESLLSLKKSDLHCTLHEILKEKQRKLAAGFYLNFNRFTSSHWALVFYTHLLLSFVLYVKLRLHCNKKNYRLVGEANPLHSQVSLSCLYDNKT